MKILAIETSCDETAIAILECAGDEKHASFVVLGNALLSQIELHKEYGGVFPALAKREHAKNLVPILEAALEEAELLREDTQIIQEDTRAKISEILAREPGLAEAFFEFISECEIPDIDAIAVTAGPGLEPALWVGINFAKALALVWGKPLVAVNHMEGHILAAIARRSIGEGGASEMLEIKNIELPLLALLISGGHTQLVVAEEWLKYKLIGETRDDAVGEAFDKVARMLALPYPGGPEISRLAEELRMSGYSATRLPYLGLGAGYSDIRLPRPMIRENNCDFSFAGLKTAVLYLLKDMPTVSDDDKKHIAHEFENAVADVLWHKTARALMETGAKTLVIGGGVSANIHIQRVFAEKIHDEYPKVALCIPSFALSTDNALMIALAGYYRALRKEFSTDVEANGNLPLA
jgi:N6-L-threonylcarbamoyladenine synthase